MFEASRIEAISAISDNVTKGAAAADYVRKILNYALGIELIDVSSDPASADLYDSVNRIRVEVKCKSSEMKHSLDEKFCHDIRYNKEDKLFIYVNLQLDKLSFRTNHIAFVYGMNPNVGLFLQELKAGIDFERESMKYKRSGAIGNTITAIEDELDKVSIDVPDPSDLVEEISVLESECSSKSSHERKPIEQHQIPISARYLERVPFPKMGITREHYDELMDYIIRIPLSDDETTRQRQQSIESSIVSHFEDILSWKIGLTDFRRGHTVLSIDAIPLNEFEELLALYDIHHNHGGCRKLRFKKWFTMNNKKASIPERQLKASTVSQQDAILEIDLDELADIELVESTEKGTSALQTIGYENILRIFKKYAAMKNSAIPTKEDVYSVAELNNTVVDVRACYGSIRQNPQYYGLKHFIDILIPMVVDENIIAQTPNETDVEFIVRLIHLAAIQHRHFSDINASLRSSRVPFNLHTTLQKSRSYKSGLANTIHVHRHEIRALIENDIPIIEREQLACKHVEATASARARTENTMKAFV